MNINHDESCGVCHHAPCVCSTADHFDDPQIVRRKSAKERIRELEQKLVEVTGERDALVLARAEAISERSKASAIERKLSEADRVFVVMHGRVPEQNAGLLRVWDYEKGAIEEAATTSAHVLPSGAVITHVVRFAKLVLEEP